MSRTGGLYFLSACLLFLTGGDVVCSVGTADALRFIERAFRDAFSTRARASIFNTCFR